MMCDLVVGCCGYKLCHKTFHTFFVNPKVEFRVGVLVLEILQRYLTGIYFFDILRN